MVFFFTVHNFCKGTIFAYGQTGCGKSHTMMGNMGEDNGSDDLRGIIPKTVRHVFGFIDS